MVLRNQVITQILRRRETASISIISFDIDSLEPRRYARSAPLLRAIRAARNQLKEAERYAVISASILIEKVAGSWTEGASLGTAELEFASMELEKHRKVHAPVRSKEHADFGRIWRQTKEEGRRVCPVVRPMHTGMRGSFGRPATLCATPE